MLRFRGEMQMAKVMISIPDEFLRRVDRTARSQGRSRSGIIREALERAMEERRSRRSWRHALIPLRDLEQHWVGQWDSTDIVRYYRDRRYGRQDRG